MNLLQIELPPKQGKVKRKEFYYLNDFDEFLDKFKYRRSDIISINTLQGNKGKYREIWYWDNNES